MFHFAVRLRTFATLQRLCLILMLAFAAPGLAGTARADSTEAAPAATRAVSLPCLGWNWSKLFSPIERMLGNQTRMIQFGVVALSSAMYIIWWRK